MNNQSGFFASLFDFSFRSFVAERVIPVLYGLSMIVIVGYAMVLVIAAFSSSAALGAVALLIGAPIFIALSLIYTRVILEFLIVAFRIANDVRSIAAQGGVAPREPLP